MQMRTGSVCGEAAVFKCFDLSKQPEGDKAIVKEQLLYRRMRSIEVSMCPQAILQAYASVRADAFKTCHHSTASQISRIASMLTWHTWLLFCPCLADNGGLPSSWRVLRHGRPHRNTLRRWSIKCCACDLTLLQTIALPLLPLQPIVDNDNMKPSIKFA